MPVAQLPDKSTAAPRPCAECRRLKHKCDKRVPCSGCVTRGCPDICPEGTNATGEGHRRFWARTAELKENLTRLALRIQELEEALRAAHALNTTSHHPLLDEGLLNWKSPFLPQDENEKSRSSSPEAVAKTNVGSLAMTEHGRTKYVGPAAWSDGCQQACQHTDRFHLFRELPENIAPPGALFPFSFLCASTRYPDSEMNDRLATLRCYLPSPEEARRLAGLYRRHCTLLLDYMPEEQFDEILKSVYEFSYLSDDMDHLRTHQLHAIVFLVFANAALFDPTCIPRGPESFKYHQLGAVALVGTPMVEAPTIESIQALGLLSRYKRDCKEPDEDSSLNVEYSLLGMICKAAYTIGLHRDPEHFNLPAIEQMRRRHLFWTIHSHEVIAGAKRSLPRSMPYGMCDTKLPDPSPTAPHTIFEAWKWAWDRDHAACIQDGILSSKGLSYDRIMTLDRKLRAHEPPPLLRYQSIIPDEYKPHTASITTRRIMVALSTHCLTLVLHRAYCATATREHSANPLGSPYGQSVTISLRSACALLAVAETSYDCMVYPATRTQWIPEVIILGFTTLTSIVSRCPALPGVEDVVRQLERTQETAAKNWDANGEAREILIRMRTLKDLARQAYAAHTSDSNEPLAPEQREAILAASPTQVIGHVSARVYAPPPVVSYLNEDELGGLMTQWPPVEPVGGWVYGV